MGTYKIHFHLAIQGSPIVMKLPTRSSYAVSGVCARESVHPDSWVDFQPILCASICAAIFNLMRWKERPADNTKNPVDGHGVPVPHFGGSAVKWYAWKYLAAETRRPMESRFRK